MNHISVLLKEILEGLQISDGDVVVDMTLGGGGHSKAMLESGASNITLIGLDADAAAKNRAIEKIGEQGQNHQIIFETIYFDSLDKVLTDHKIEQVDKVLFDLGYSSFEIDDPERGFSFLNDGPLKMTYSQDGSGNTINAFDVVNSFSEENLADIIYGFGQEQFSRRIAKAIIESREEKEIHTTKELAEIINAAVPKFYRHQKDGGRSKIHPATKTFQAIRIAVNSELERLKIALNKSFEHLSKGGRIAVISFHSLEDKIVKTFFKEKATEKKAILVNKKPIIPQKSEIVENPRSRSAKLRIIEKI